MKKQSEKDISEKVTKTMRSAGPRFCQTVLVGNRGGGVRFCLSWFSDRNSPQYCTTDVGGDAAHNYNKAHAGKEDEKNAGE